MRFSLTTLFVEDLAPIRDWYQAHLGLRVTDQTERFVRLADGSGQSCLAFHVGEPVSSPNRVQLHFEVDDVDAEAQRLQGEGVTIEESPTDKPWGWRVTSMRDPAGHTVELVKPR